MAMLRNEIIIDGFVREDSVKYFTKMMSFMISSSTGSIKNDDGTYKNRYSMFNVKYFKEPSQKMIDKIKKGACIRVYGRIDTEEYNNKDGNKVYNKILIANDLSLITFEKDESGKTVGIKEEAL